MRSNLVLFLLVGLISVQSNCSKKGNGGGGGGNNVTGATIDYWLTKGDKSALLQKQTATLQFSSASNTDPTIDVDSTQTFQTIDGFGYTLTGGSAYLINKLSASDKASLLQELFGSGSNSIGVSYLRISIGASDLSASVFSYNDLPPGQTDVPLANFSLSLDTVDLIPLLKEILAINPNIKIMGSPWSPPLWMKDNGSSIGGSLLPQYYETYARYFVKYIQEMKTRGITVDAITPQNEPLHGGNNPSMVMTALQQAEFIKNHLGPAFSAAGITTNIVIYDHNADRTDYPATVLSDPGAMQYIDGSAFHLYGGDINALSSLHNMFPDKHIYFTEQWTGANSSFDGDLKWHLKNVIIGSTRNWSKVVLEWNLANDGSYNPHTPGGCTECKGALTLDGAINRNVAYYIIAHASRFVPPGSVRIASNIAATLHNVAFLRPDGKKVVIVVNDGAGTASFNIRYKGLMASTSLATGAAATYVW